MTRPIAVFPVAACLLAGVLAGCETTGPGPADAAARPVAEPMTHTRAARECWMSTEKGRADMPLDKRSEIVDRCIEQKMRGVPAGAPKS